MSTERIIHLADLSAIYQGLSAIRHDVDGVNNRVESVGAELVSTRSELALLTQQFLDFVEADAKSKQVAISETRLIKIRQQLETQYGHYAKVRRHATGVLQAADVNIIRQETVHSVTEQLMLDAPRYWLAPALVALSAWLADDQPLAQKALAEAIRRDDEKTSLFFALISRRAARAKATYVWLDRYFGMQDPTSLDRQTVVLVDALASGIFGSDIRTHCAKRIESWTEELSQRAGFLEEQRQQWTDALRSKIPTHAANLQRYRHLAQYSPTWQELESGLRGTEMQGNVLAHFRGIFEGPIQHAATLALAVDKLLENLVSNFDDEELPLRRDEALCELIIAEDGDRAAAKTRFDLEHKALDEYVSFTQLLTNAAMHPEKSHASRATQRFAIALSRNWIKDAHQDLTASLRAAVPLNVTLSIEDWSGETRNGENEQELTDSLRRHIEARKQAELAKIKLSFMQWAALVIGVMLMLYAFKAGFFPFAIGLAGVVWFFYANYNLKKQRAQITAQFDELKEASVNALKATIAELVELRRELEQRDAVATDVIALLDAVTPSQYMTMAHDKARQVITTNA